METLSLACRCLLVLVFLASSTGKLRREAFGEFRASVRAARLLPEAAVSPALTTVVAAELAAAVLLVVPPTVRFGAVLAGGLLAGFVVVILASARRRTGLACRCFGGDGAVLGLRHVARNVVLLAACAVVVLVPPSLPARVEPGVLAFVAAGVLAVLAIRLDDLLDLAAPPARTWEPS
ncbi:MauE/DoxX family redox-associated membrane protein [Cellulomonas gelida]|uniref:Methylamine utilization protein MauE n=1 Tax=Cellulomonas gelida TaxID=1712 RepID=A0A4Y3KMC7_9CELL|nr:MauE/DoxX family redox-associated membrane protein [Cellulomonas gelida]GEA85137.1 methylamine utilization protein MauE [Cellulomonas gelida]GGL20280.1 methylamine utilization protein MauE [Cellulomonas gelida]